MKASLEAAVVEAEPHLDLAREYLTARGILHAVASRFRLGVVPESSSNYQGRLLIPSIGPRGNVYNVRYRSLDGREPKYLGLPGMENRLFNVRALKEADDEIHITEGELDAIILEACGFHAVAAPGANSWARHSPCMFSGFTRIWIWGDGDKAGGDFAKKVHDSLSGATIVRVPDGMDVNDIYLADGIDGIRKAMGIDE